MMYKIMSTVKAHLDEEKRIVSPTQTLLQSNILQNSELIPEKIRKKITSSNVVVDKNSLSRDDVCRGDIYVETTDTLSLSEQRQLVDGMSRISHKFGSPLMSPVVIRNAPDDMPKPAASDWSYKLSVIDSNSTYKETQSAFIGAKASLSFPEAIDVKSTYRRAETVAKALNKELNAVGLRTVFADTSVCTCKNPIKRDCYVIMQKTSRFNPATFTSERLVGAIQSGLASDKIGVSEPPNIELLSVAGQRALIGSVSLENVQMSGKRAIEQMRSIKSLSEAALVFTMMEQNPLFVNGIGRDGERMVSEIVDKFNVPRYPKIVEPLFSGGINKAMTDGFQSSTEQPLSTKWQLANAAAIHLTGEKSRFDVIHTNINDIMENINDVYGCDDKHPLIESALFSVKTGIRDNSVQALYLVYNPSVISGEISSVKQNIVDCFKQSLSEYQNGSLIEVNGNQPQPLMIDLSTAKPLRSSSVSISINKPMKESLTATDVIQPLPDVEQQISL